MAYGILTGKSIEGHKLKTPKYIRERQIVGLLDAAFGPIVKKGFKTEMTNTEGRKQFIKIHRARILSLLNTNSFKYCVDYVRWLQWKKETGRS